MNPAHLPLLACPSTKRPLILEETVESCGRIETGLLREPESGNTYPIVRGIPRFVPLDNYAASFGHEWNTHSRTQYDDTTGFDASGERFRNETRWGDDLSGELMLEVGSGSGRFTREALKTGATVVSLDYSTAVEANRKSNGSAENLLLVQASVFEMPFHPGRFDKAFCIGVLQHTPDPKGAFHAIVGQLKPGGRIASDVYIKDLRHWMLQTKYWIRPFIRKDDPARLYEFLKSYVDFMWPLARLIRRVPLIGYAINWRLLVADYSKLLPDASDEVLKEWAYLDTFDMLSPAFDKPQTVSTFRRWHFEAGLEEIDVHPGYNGVEGRARKPQEVG